MSCVSEFNAPSVWPSRSESLARFAGARVEEPQKERARFLVNGGATPNVEDARRSVCVDRPRHRHRGRPGKFDIADKRVEVGRGDATIVAGKIREQRGLLFEAEITHQLAVRLNGPVGADEQRSGGCQGKQPGVRLRRVEDLLGKPEAAGRNYGHGDRDEQPQQGEDGQDAKHGTATAH